MKNYTENEIATLILDVAFKIHKELGPGLFESVYESILEYELTRNYGLVVKRQTPIPFIWKEVKMDLGFRSDLLVEERVIVELKSIESLAPVHSKQVLTHLRLMNLKLGLLINFNVSLLKEGIKRIANNL